jgi:membrane protein DedA with SNARE-associated domain
MMRRWNIRAAIVGVLLVALVLLILGILEGDLADDLTHVGSLVVGLLNRFGVAACLVLLYIEESGVPLPVPGDFYVAFVGKLYAGSFPSLLAAWLGILAVVVAGSSNLFWISRRWGPQLLRNRLVRRLLQLDEARLERARRWFDRWGALAIIFGRHLPGFRVTITVIAGSVGVPYTTFVPSVAVSTAIWAGVGLWLGATFGQSIGHILSSNPWIYLAAFGLAILGLAVLLVRAWRRADAHRAMPA